MSLNEFISEQWFDDSESEHFYYPCTVKYNEITFCAAVLMDRSVQGAAASKMMEMEDGGDRCSSHYIHKREAEAKEQQKQSEGNQIEIKRQKSYLLWAGEHR